MTRPAWDIINVKCYNCNKKGHYSNECPDKDPDKATVTVTEEANEMENYDNYDNWEEFNFHQSNWMVNPTWILLDNCSTTNIFCNSKLLTDFRASSTTLKIQCNAVTKEVNQVGTLKNYGTVWYSKSVIANKLSLSQVKKISSHMTAKTETSVWS
jgi:hypothetical protein